MNYITTNNLSKEQIKFSFSIPLNHIMSPENYSLPLNH